MTTALRRKLSRAVPIALCALESIRGFEHLAAGRLTLGLVLLACLAVGIVVGAIGLARAVEFDGLFALSWSCWFLTIAIGGFASSSPMRLLLGGMGIAGLALVIAFWLRELTKRRNTVA